MMNLLKKEIVNRETSLLHFLTPSQEKKQILVLESIEYLPYLREMFPQSKICCTMADLAEQDLTVYDELAIEWHQLRYQWEKLPFDQGCFDYIIGEQCLDQTANPQDILYGLGLYLQPTGQLLTSFNNIRYWQIIKNLQEGHFYHVCSRCFATEEMIKLLSAAFFKDVDFAPGPEGDAQSPQIGQLEAMGFVNGGQDLGVKIWLMAASKSMAEILNLKRMYTQETRRELVTLFRRLEFGIEVRQNTEDLLNFCQEEHIFVAYLAAFVKETITHLNDLLWSLLPEVEQIGPLGWKEEFLQALLESYQGQPEYELVLAWLCGRPEEAYHYNPEAVAGCLQTAGESQWPQLPSERKIAFITCVNNEENYQEALLYMKHLFLPQGMGAEFIAIRGAKSMCQGYNQGQQQTNAQYKVYVHQDVLLVNKYLVWDLLKIFASPTVGAVGVMGARSLPASGIWWDGMRIYGKVLHACEAESCMLTDSMEPPEEGMEVEAVDGLMIATQKDIPWREDLFTGWHFYDVSMCKELQRLGYQVLVPHQERFWCIHMPKEKPLDPAYGPYQRKFLQEYGAELEPEI